MRNADPTLFDLKTPKLQGQVAGARSWRGRRGVRSRKRSGNSGSRSWQLGAASEQGPTVYACRDEGSYVWRAFGGLHRRGGKGQVWTRASHQPPT